MPIPTPRPVLAQMHASLAPVKAPLTLVDPLLAIAAQGAPLAPDGPGPVGVRLLWYAALLLAAGAATFALRVLPEARIRGASDGAREHAERWCLVAAGAAAVFALTVLGLRFPREGLEVTGWPLQAAGTALLVAAVVPAARGRRGGWIAVAAATAILSLATALSGHAGRAPLPWLAAPVDAVHVLASGAWLGSLAILLLALPGLLRRPGGGATELGRLARAFSDVALPAAAVVVASGVLRTLFHVQSAAELWRTVYGNTLTFKVGIAAGALFVGLYNWRKVLPRLETRRGPRALRRSGSVELLIALLVLLVTAVLVALPLP